MKKEFNNIAIVVKPNLTNSKEFGSSEVITGESSGATATTSATTTGDTVIKSRYVFDTGMRDNFYDISRITRKKGSAAPTGRLLIIYDYLEHGAGDMFTVDSYTDIAGRMEYDDIPVYTGSKVDPDEPVPSGQFPLTDSYDYRPTVDDIAGSSTTIATVDEITGRSFDFASRTFGGTGGTTVDTPKSGSFIQADFEYYLPKMAALALSPSGGFRIFEGTSSENPLLPKFPDDAMLIATMFIPPYTFKPYHIDITREKHQRYTMKDIGKLEDRLDNVEYYTALTLLERNAESFEVTDANGLNRFKSGFVVDNFKGHRIGDTAHRDYKNSMDFEAGELRPQHRSKAIDLIEVASTTAERTADGYQKTGDMLTLPYTEETLTSQLFASRQVSAQTGQTVNWIGDIEISPTSDTWYETEISPVLVVNRDGDYDAVVARERNNLGTVWNAWQTTWSGVVDSRTETQTKGVRITVGGGEDTHTTTATRVGKRSIQTVRTDKTRTGVTTSVALRVDKESQGIRTVSKAAIPYVRAKTITFTGENFKPKTRLYFFFNKTNVSSYCTPASTAYTTDSTPVAGSPIVTTATGKVEGTFAIPDPKVAGNPKFTTGEVLLTFTSSSTNATISKNAGLGTAGTVSYSASGLLETQQETIIATRNAVVVRTNASQKTSASATSHGKWAWHTQPQPKQTKSWEGNGYDPGGGGSSGPGGVSGGDGGNAGQF